MAPKFFTKTLYLAVILALCLAAIPAPALASSPRTESTIIKEHAFKFYLDPALAPDMNFAKTVLVKYVNDMNSILFKNTSCRLVFNPETDIILTNTRPHSNQAAPPLPAEGFEIWAHAIHTNFQVSFGGYAGIDDSGAGVLAGLRWTKLYDPDQLTPNEVLDYWTQINNMLHELAHVFGAGYGEYYNLSTIQDMTGVSPLLNINILEQNDSFWSDKPDFMTDPLLKNAAQNNIAGQSDNRENLLNFVEYSELTAAIINNNYRNGTPTVDLSQINIRVVSEDGLPVESAAIKIWSVVGGSPYQTQLMVDDFSNADGELNFAWGGMSNPHNSYDFLRLIKVYKEGYAASAKYVSIFDADIVKLVDGGIFLNIMIRLSPINASKVLSLVRASANPAIPTTDVDFTVTFSDSVTDVDTGDFSLATTSGVSDATLSGVSGSGSIYTVTVNTGSGTGDIRLDVPVTATIPDLAGNPLSELPFNTGETYTVDQILPSPWVGGISISSDKNIVAVGRPHIGAEVASYNGFSSGTLTAYIPMLFKNAFGGSYDSAFYIQNVDSAPATISIKYYDSNGDLTCTAPDTIEPLASKGYWMPGLSAACLPDGWVGSAVVTSDKNIVANGRPHIGAEVMTYDGFSSGTLTSYLPMLFKNAFGGSYDSAFYVQNVDPANAADLTIKYYDSAGVLTCTVTGETVAPLASKGYWLPALSVACLPDGWVGGVEVTSTQPIVTVGRPHIGTQVTTYNGFSAGAGSSYVPMLFKNAFAGGTYDAAFYVQNVGASTATISIQYYDLAGNLTCTVPDSVEPLASKGYWLPGLPAACLPDGWVGGAVVTSDVDVVAIGRPHIGNQVTTYNGFTSGSVSSYLPMLFKDAFSGSYNSAFYVQNTEATTATVTTQFFDDAGALTCSRTDTLPAFSTLSLWLPSLTCVP